MTAVVPDHARGAGEGTLDTVVPGNAPQADENTLAAAVPGNVPGSGTRAPDGGVVGHRVPDALAALRAGRPVLVADDTSRENEVDVVLAAASATAEWVAWTVRHTSGYLCAPMPAARADALNLPLMWEDSEDVRRTAYTVSVDARGVGTGISAAERALTLRTLADPATTAGDLIRPGHVLPLRARPGGVRERQGHTEAAVDLVRLAEAGPEGVAAIAELVADDGTMLRYDDAARLAAELDLVLITVADLVAYLDETAPVTAAGGRAAGRDMFAGVENETHAVAVSGTGAGTGTAAGPAGRVERVATALLPTEHGPFEVTSYRDVVTNAEHLVLVPAALRGHGLAGEGAGSEDDADPRGSGTADAASANGRGRGGAAAGQAIGSAEGEAALVRVHSECLTGDAFGSLRCDCGPQLAASLRAVSEAAAAGRPGAVVYLRGHEGRGIGLADKIAAYALQDRGLDTVDANEQLGLPVDAREYGAAAAILADLGIRRVELLTNNPAKTSGLTAQGAGLGIEVVGRQALHVGAGPENARYLATKQARMGHLLGAPTTTTHPTTTGAEA